MHLPFVAPPPAFAAIVYPPDQRPEALVAAFTARLATRGFRLGGLIQETTDDTMELIDLEDGHRWSIRQALGPGSKACLLDHSALAEASSALRRAVEHRVDLLVVNKFSGQEKTGKGLAPEMLAAMAAGVPLLTTVPMAMIGDWTAFTGGLGELLAPTEAALWRWWGPRRIYDDLAQGVADVPAGRVVVGLNFTLVEGPHGIGLAQTPERGAAGCAAAPGAGSRAGVSLAELAGLVRSWNPFELALGIAACNAHYNRFDLSAATANGLSMVEGSCSTVVIGGFPGIRDRLPGCRVIERQPDEGDYPEAAAEWLLPGAESVVITSSALANRSLPRLLSLAPQAKVVLVGPGAPLTERLFDYGISASAGVVATDAEGLIRAVAEGAAARDVKRFCREVVVGG